MPIILRVRDQLVSASAHSLAINMMQLRSKSLTMLAGVRNLSLANENRRLRRKVKQHLLVLSGVLEQAHRLAAEGQEEESDNLPNNDEVARPHVMVMSTDIHRP